jgi:hypothetical protein
LLYITLASFKLSTAEEVGHSSAESNTQRSQPHTRFKDSKTIREIDLHLPETFNTLFVQRQISNVGTEAVLDTGAQVSVISKDFYQKLKFPPAFSDHVILKGICKSHLESRICRNVPIEIGQFKGKWNFVVADIVDTILSSLDFLEYHKAIINLQDVSVSIGKIKLQLSVSTTKTKKR